MVCAIRVELIFCVYFHKQKNIQNREKVYRKVHLFKQLIGNTPSGGAANSLHTGDEVHLGTASMIPL